MALETLNQSLNDLFSIIGNCFEACDREVKPPTVSQVDHQNRGVTGIDFIGIEISMIFKVDRLHLGPFKHVNTIPIAIS